MLFFVLPPITHEVKSTAKKKTHYGEVILKKITGSNAKLTYFTGKKLLTLVLINLILWPKN
jgi:hypothetical protein